jgi:CubicO group peptidase (beta-lactamase class C family)
MSNKEAAVTAVLQKCISEKVFPGCAVVLISGEQKFATGLGYFTYHSDSSVVDTKTLYDVASLTKIVAPMAVAMMLIDEEVLDLDEKVGTYLPEFVNQPEKELALLSHLMTYTLDYDIPGGSKSVMGQLTPDQVAHNCLVFQLKATPGSNYMYSNITAFILTQLIERVTGRHFADLVQEKVLNPLHMQSATFSPPRALIHRIPPTEITADRGEVKGFVHDEFTHKTTAGGISNGAAGLFASIADMQQFLQMTLNRGRGLFSEEMASLWTRDYYPELLPVHTPVGWGDLNNKLIDDYHRDIVVKAGFTGCFMVADLKNNKGFVLLSNRTYPQRPDNASGFADLKEELMKIVLS